MLKALLQKRADLVNEASATFDLAASENRNLTADEIARDDAISAELTELNANITRAERQADRQRSVGAVVDQLEAGDRPFAQARTETASFANVGDQLLAIARAEHPAFKGTPIDNRLIQAGPTGAGEGIGSDGGFLVQTDFASEMIQNMYDGGDVASRIRKIQIGPNSNGISMNGIDENSRANGSRWGGIRSYWTGEAQLMLASQPKFKRIKQDLDKLTGVLYATDELLADSTALASWIPQAFSDEFTFKVEDSIVNGTGAGQPLGFLNSGATITVSKEAGQGAATINAENIVKMWARMPARNRRNAVWYVNQDVEPQLYLLNLKIKNVAGTENVGGIAIPAVIYTPPGTNGNTFGNLMGRPVIPIEYAATLGTAGDLILADPSQYLGIEKGGIKSASSIHVRFLYEETAFRFTYRFNGMPIWNAPMTPYKGTATQSPFVVLETRA